MSDIEALKAASRQLRGGIREALADGRPCFDAASQVLLKFHGIYQEEDRDQTAARKQASQPPAYGFLVRVKLAGGNLSADQYLRLDALAHEFSPVGLRVTSRQDFQFHAVPKDRLQPLLAQLRQAGLTTWGGAGDVARNVVVTAAPFTSPVYLAAQRLAVELTAQLEPAAEGYRDVWGGGDARVPANGGDRLYGDAYLPRKFKVALCIPPRNDVDVLTNDLGFIAHAPNGPLDGFTVVAGGGLGMKFGDPATYPALAQPLCFVRPEQVTPVARAVLGVFRDHGDRTDRKQARLKYLLAKRGIEWFRAEVAARLPFPVEPPKGFTLETVADLLGWVEQGNGRLAFGLRVDGGRITDHEAVRCRSALKALVRHFRCPVRATPNHNVLLLDLAPGDREEFNAILREHGTPAPAAVSPARQISLACVARPTCGFALAESERVFPALMEEVERLLRELGLADEPILFRMTGCSNGCARPYVADFGFVGRGPGKYAVYAGGSRGGDRLAHLVHAAVPLAELPATVRPFLEAFARERRPGETFSAWWGRREPAVANKE